MEKILSLHRHNRPAGSAPLANVDADALLADLFPEGEGPQVRDPGASPMRPVFKVRETPSSPQESM